MDSEELDHLVKKAAADVILQNTASQLKEILQQMVRVLDPFPYFLGSNHVRAVEAEPGMLHPRQGEVPALAVSYHRSSHDAFSSKGFVRIAKRKK